MTEYLSAAQGGKYAIENTILTVRILFRYNPYEAWRYPRYPLLREVRNVTSIFKIIIVHEELLEEIGRAHV